MSSHSRNQLRFVLAGEVVVVVVVEVEVGTEVDVVSTVELGSQSGSFAESVEVVVGSFIVDAVGSPSIV
jgi:hypothetical protein